MSTEVTKFNPADYVDKIRDKIKQSLVDVIPDEQWNAMLRAEIEGFFKSPVSPSGGVSTYYDSQRERPSEFRRIVLNVLEEEVKKRTKDMLSSPEWLSYWDGNKQKAGEEIARLARENGALILAKWLESAIAQVIDSIRFNNR